MSLSGLCLVHCLAGSLVLILASGVGGIFSHEVHAVGLAIAIPLGAVGLRNGYRRHRRLDIVVLGIAGLALMAAGLFAAHGHAAEIVFTVAGVTLLGAAHLYNLRHRG